MRSLKLGLVVCLVLMSVTFAAKAQTLATATVTGTVQDPSGANVPGAQVEIRETKTGLARLTVTNSVGRYQIVSVLSGGYSLTVTAQGFQTYVVPAFTVEVSKSYTFDVTLTVGGVHQTVTVEATAGAELQTLDSTVGATMTADQLTLLPSFDRDVMVAQLYQPMTSAANGAVAGSRNDENAILIDGGNGTEDTDGTAGYRGGWVNGAASHSMVMTPIESIEEFRINASNQTATFNASSGAQIMLVTKHGTNAFHGSAYWYHQNSALNANGWGFNFQNNVLKALGNPVNRKQPMKDNRWGGSIGGPIWKNHTFFYFLYELRKFPQNAIFSAQVPSDSLRQGILKYRGYADGSGPIQSFDLKTAMICGPSGNLPCDPRGVGISPIISKMWSTLIPEPTLATPADTNFSTFLSPLSLPVRDATQVLRLDHQFNEKWRLMASARYSSHNNKDSGQVDIGGLVPGDTKGVAAPLRSTPGWGRLFVVGLTGQPTPTFTNDFRWSYSRNFWQYSTAHVFPQIAGADQAMSLFSDGSVGAIPINIDTQTARSRIWNGHTTTYNDNATWMKGNHAIQFGGIQIHQWYYHNRDDKLIGALTYPVWHLENVTGLQYPDLYRPPTCVGATQMNCLASGSLSDWNNMYTGTLGMVANGTYIGTRDGDLNQYPPGTPIFGHLTTESYTLYAADTWRVRPSFTLTYGLTWRNDMPPHMREGKLAMMMDPTTGKIWDATSYLSQKEAAALKGEVFNPTLGFMPINKLGRKYPFDPKWTEFGPRIAAAWNPNITGGPLGKIFGGKKTVIRGGFGIVYERVDGVGQVMFPLLGLGFGSVLTCSAPGIDGICHGAADPRDASNGYRIGVDGSGPPLPKMAAQATPIIPGVNGPYESVSLALDPKRGMGPDKEWNFSIQRELPGNTILEIGYMGRSATGLFYPLDEGNIPYMMTVGGQSFAKAFDAVAVQLRGGTAAANVTAQPFFETALGGQGSAYCGTRSCTATVATNFTSNLLYPQVSSMWTALDGHWTFGPMVPQTKQVGMLFDGTNDGYSNYNAGFVQVRKTVAHGLTLNTNFTYSHLNDTMIVPQNQNDTSGNAYHPSFDYGPSINENKFSFNFIGLYELPFGRGHRMSFGSGSLGAGALNKIIGGWSAAPIYTFYSGQPASIQPGMDPWGAGIWGGGGEMVPTKHQNTTTIHMNSTGTNGWGVASSQGPPYYGSGANAFSDPQAAGALFRPILISQDQTGYGNSPNGGYGGGPIRQIPSWNLNMTFAKTTKITERVDVRFTAECNNLLNHTQWNIPGAYPWNVASPTSFGVINGGGAGRAIQLGLRIGF